MYKNSIRDVFIRKCIRNQNSCVQGITYLIRPWLCGVTTMKSRGVKRENKGMFATTGRSVKRIQGPNYEHEISVELETTRTHQLPKKLKHTKQKTIQEDKETIQTKAIKIVSDVTNKAEGLFVANIYPAEFEEIEKIEKVKVSTKAKFVDWCTGCEELNRKLNLESEKKHYYRIVLALQDLNSLKRLEKHSSKILQHHFKALRGSRVSYAHYLQKKENEEDLNFKMSVLLEKMTGMSEICKETFASRFHENFIPEVIAYLRNLPLNSNVPVSRGLVEETEDWWIGVK